MPDPIAFRVMNEIGIIDQLGRTIFERAMPHGLTVSQFVVLESLRQAWRRSQSTRTRPRIAGHQGDHDEHAAAA